MNTTAIVLKVTGQLFVDAQSQQLTRVHADNLATQLKQLQSNYSFSIVIGGGAFFRGNQHNNVLGIRSATAHTVGMLATTMSSLILYDILYEHDIKSTLLNAFDCALIDKKISQQAIDESHHENRIIIFGGGTGNPFVTTDTCAVIRAQQVGAKQLWKATNVDGIYTADPHFDLQAHIVKQLSYQEALDKKLRFMDHTAITLAQQEGIMCRVFNIFAPNALIHVAHDMRVGSIIQA
jgi:uridylate kinase